MDWLSNTARIPRATFTALAAAAWLACGPVGAQPTETVVITASGAERRAFETPYAVTAVTADELRAAGPMVNLSEALARVPGLVVANRSNHAQDLQIHSRGFGARASFGVRGMRLYSDGIPASGPDGQGQVSHFDLAGAARVEVLRGPFTALYGSSSGGVIALVSAAPIERQLRWDVDVGSEALRQGRLSMEAPLGQGLSLRAQVSRFETDGFRPQSEARRTLGNVRLGWEQGAERVTLVLNSIHQPAQDPLGLTRAQFVANPRQTTAVALPQETPGQTDRFNTRKNTRQDQAGLSWRHAFGDAGALVESRVALFAGQRSVTQWQAIPVATQLNTANPALTERQPGGVIDFDRSYQGLDARLLWRWALSGERSLELVAGLAAEQTREERRGFENFSGAPAVRLLGVTGTLRRDESNRLDSRDVFAQAEAGLAPRWTATLGVRSGRVTYASTDRFIRGTNADDSGREGYRFTNPVAALQWKPRPQLNLYLSAGRGFEAPTLNELAYRPDGAAGFNLDLKAQTSRQWELGAKWREGGTAADVAVFEARTDDEIGIATNRGGRSTFRNVGRTQRRGLEAALGQRLGAHWRAHLSLSWLDARYVDGFAVCAALPCLTPTLPVPAGNRIAGTQREAAYAELAYAPALVPKLELAAELRARGSVPVNDVNSDQAAGHALLALRARYEWRLPGGILGLLVRVDNLANRSVAGSVIVNEGNARFFEPAPGRAWLLSARYARPF
jgi:iron complex outermembrane recepter protein